LSRVTRVGVTFPPRLLSELDDVVEKVGYPNRSKAIQDSVKAFVTEHKWLSGERGPRIGVIVLAYDHESRGLQDYLTDTQHRYAALICSSTHVHLSEQDCLEAILVRGDAARIRELVEKLRARRGVKQTKFSVVSS